MIMKKGVPLAIVAVLIVAALLAAGWTFLGEVYAETTTAGYHVYDIEGGTPAQDEMLDSVGYVTAWSGGGSSEKIVAQGWYRTVDYGSEVQRYWYVVKITGSAATVVSSLGGSEWVRTVGDVWAWTSAKVEAPSQDINNWYPTKVLILVLEGPTTGKVTVELWCHHYWSYGISAGDDMISRDEAYLKDGVGSVIPPSEVVEEGTNAYFTVKTGYSSTVKTELDSNYMEGWTLRVSDPNGAEVWRQSVNDNFGPAKIAWLVPEGMYKTTWNNTFVVQLRNELINQDEQTLFVIGAGMLAMIPEKPTFELTDEADEYVAGDLLEIRVSAELNPIGFPITGFIMSYAIVSATGTVYEYVFENAFYPALREGTSDTYFADVKITFPQQGVVKLWASTIDSMQLNSGNAWVTFDVAGMGSIDDDDDEGGSSLSWVGLAALAAIIAVFGVIIAVFVPLQMHWRLILMMAMFVAAAAIVVVWGLPAYELAKESAEIAGGAGSLR